jgi:phage shock protein B
MDGLILAFIVPTLVFLIVVLPFWIFMHYRSKQRSRHELTEDERRLLQRLTEQAEQMAERIGTLEAILDAQTPDWRRERESERVEERRL